MCRLWHTQNTDPDTSSPLDVSIIKINWMFFIEQSEPTKRWHIRLQHIARQDFRIVQKKGEYEKLFNISRGANKEEVWSACCFNRVAQTNNVSDEKGKQKSWIYFRLTFSRQSCAERKTQKEHPRRKSIELNFRQWVLLWYTKKNSWRRKLCDNYLCELVPIKRKETNIIKLKYFII